MKFLFNLFLIMSFVVITSCTEKIDTKEVKAQVATSAQVNEETKAKPLDSLYNVLSGELKVFFNSVGESSDTFNSYEFDPVGNKKQYMFLVKNRDTISVSHWMGYYPKKRVNQKVITSRLYPNFDKNYVFEVIVVDKSHSDDQKKEIHHESINNIDAMQVAQNFFYNKIQSAQKYKSKESERLSHLISKN